MKYAAVFFILLMQLLPAQAASDIRGKVIDTETNDPITGAEVRIAGTDLRACTDSQGNYSLDGAISGYGYEVRILKNGYRPQQIFVVATQNGIEASAVLQRSSDASYADCRIRPLQKDKPFWEYWSDDPPHRIQYMISGLVVDDETNQLLSNVIVWTTPASRIVKTGDNGTYVIWSGLSPQEYTITAIKRGFYTDRATVRLLGGRSIVQGDLVLRQKE